LGKPFKSGHKFDCNKILIVSHGVNAHSNLELKTVALTVMWMTLVDSAADHVITVNIR